MPYATPTEFKALFPEDESVELSNLDDPDATAANDALIQSALDEAQSEVDSYVGMVADLPLSSTPLVLKNAVCRIARYRLDAYSPRDNVRQDYDDVIKWLEKLVDGKVGLGLDEDGGSPTTDSGVAYFAGTRKFTERTLYGYGM